MAPEFKNITPDLMVDDISETVRYYTDKLGFRLCMLVPEGENIIEEEMSSSKRYVYAMVKKDRVFLMFMRRDIYEKDIPVLENTGAGASATFYIDSENVTGLLHSYEKKGVEVIKGLSETWYGMKEFYIRDCNGYILGFVEKA
jgi:uncharacterized glyoxalase superfamily protein PhnB